MGSKEHWDREFAKGQASDYSRVEMPAADDPVLAAASQHFGSMDGKRILDLGSGSGKASLYFARRAAHVLSVDQSEVATSNLKAFCAQNGIRNIQPIQCSALDIESLGPVDFVFGSMILHHIEPLETFAGVLNTTLAKGGRAFFWENNAFSKTMIWFRQHVVGRWWVPKFGDSDEFPLTPAEVTMLRKWFHVEVSYPELLYFRLVSDYILRGRLRAPFEFLDAVFYNLPWFRRYSYRQYLAISRRP